MSQLLQHIAQLRQGDPAPLLSYIPYTRFLGMSVRINEQQLLGRLAFAQRLIGNPMLPALHGGAVAALLESTAIFQLLWQHDSLVLPKTINITVQYLRSGKPEDTYAEARITKLGRRVVAMHANAWQQERERPIASAIAHFLLTES